MSNPSDRVLGTPPTNTSADMSPEPPAESIRALETGLAIQQRERETALHELARLRKEVRDQIEQMITLLDQSDEYVSTELEEAVDDGACDDTELEPSLGSFDRMNDQSKSWRRLQGEFGVEDDAEKDDADAEPSLGFLERPASLYGNGRDHSGGQLTAVICSGLGNEREEEHDGAEPENEHGDGNPDDEPSLGWTIDGHGLRTELGREDLELATPTVGPQNRTELDGPQIDAETSYRKFLYGLTDEQKKAFRERMTEQHGTTGVVLR